MSGEGEFEVIVHPLDDGSYWAEVDGLPGCVTQGGSYSQILSRLRDAHGACCVALDIAPGEGSVSPVSLKGVITAGDLARRLGDGGWSVVYEGAQHRIYRAPGRVECVSVLTESESPLVPALVASLTALFSHP